MGKICTRELHSTGCILFGPLQAIKIVRSERFAASDNFIGNRLQRFIDVVHGRPSSSEIVTTIVLIVERTMFSCKVHLLE